MSDVWFTKPWRADLTVVLVALLVRVVVLITGSDAPTFNYPVVDAATYDQAARALATGEGLDWRFFWQPFLYPVSLAGIYLVSGGSILAAKIIQLLAGVATCWFVLRIARRHLGIGTGLLAGMFCALHGPMIFFEGELLATGWATFWAVFLLDRLTDPRPESRYWMVTGALGALAVLTRPTFLPAILVGAALVAWRERAWRKAAIGAVVFATLVAPVAILGSSVASHPSILPASGAMNLYLGNHPEPCETLTVRPGEAWKELTARAKPAGAGDLVANRKFFSEALVANLTGDPVAVARGVGRKSLQVISTRELPRNVDPYGQREWSPVLAVLMFKVDGFGFPMGLLLPLAVVGAWSTRRKLPPAFFAFIGVYLLAVIAVFVSARYRMPMVPAVAILAAGGLVALVQAFREGAARGGAIMLAVVLAMGLLGSAPGPFCEEEVDYRAETLYAVGYAQHNAGELDAAAFNYGQALEQRPEYVELLNQYALLRSQQGRATEAIDLWTRAVRVEPGDLTVRLNLGRAYAKLERHLEAFENFDAATRIDSGHADAWIGSGFALLGLARFEEGVDRLERGLQRDPRYASRMPMVIDALRGRGEFGLADRLDAAFRRAGGRG
jgi:4-amino-4-deoxy-L-arabinose transferase-like glycosyltransferase